MKPILLGFALGCMACGGGQPNTDMLSGDSLLAMMKKPYSATLHEATMATPDIATNYDMEVSTAQELLDEVQSGALVRLRPGNFILSDLAAKRFGGWIEWKHIAKGIEETKSPKMLVFHDLNNVIIQGKKGSTLLNQSDGATILVFRNCSNILLEGLAFQNLCSQEKSTGGALVFIGCNGVFVRQCETTGYHAFAVEAYQSKDIHLYKNTFQGCHHQAVRMQDCSNVFIKNNEIKNNTFFNPLLDFVNCSAVEVHNASLVNNRAHQPTDTAAVLLSSQNCSNLHWQQGILRKNQARAALHYTGTAPQRLLVQEEENVFQ